MKKLTFLMAALLVAMTGCQKEPQVEQVTEGDAYMSFTIQTMTTRSATDNPAAGDTPSNANPDYEVGTDVENTISEVNVVLKKGNKFISATNVDKTGETNDGSETGIGKKWVAKFNSSELVAGEQYDVYIYANCGAQTSLDSKSNAEIGAMTVNNKFWMTNAYAAQKCNAITLSSDPANPFDLGTVYVERAMARFDYMKVADNYTLTKDTKTKVTLTDMTLINESKEFYYLRRTVLNSLLNEYASNVTYGGSEVPNNYVIDTDWESKKAATPAYASLFNNPLSTFAAGISSYDAWTEIASLTNNDNWTDAGAGKHEDKEYKVWRYVKENTVPGKSYQTNGLTTGVVFKGEISSTNDDINTDMTNGKTIYAFDNVLYGSWDRVVTAAAAPGANVTLKYYVEEAWNKLVPSNDALAAAGFTSFVASGTAGNYHYYTYYYYWNRHNDNGSSTTMGDMEFAVVRNNVYKLCVDSIAKLGHPDEKGADPDPEDSTKPDESGEHYFKVTAKVLPWVVRVNHIEF